MAKLSDDKVRDISEQVYRRRLGADDTARMLEKDNDDGKKLRQRAGFYDPVVSEVLDILGVDEDFKTV